MFDHEYENKFNVKLSLIPKELFLNAGEKKYNIDAHHAINIVPLTDYISSPFAIFELLETPYDNATILPTKELEIISHFINRNYEIKIEIKKGKLSRIIIFNVNEIARNASTKPSEHIILNNTRTIDIKNKFFGDEFGPITVLQDLCNNVSLINELSIFKS